jgi:hypothetical protein
MSSPFALDTVLAMGVDPHRESLDVVAIHFPEKIVLDEAFDNTRAGHHTLWSGAQALADEQNLSLAFGLKDDSNYGYALGRYLVNQGCRVKKVNPRMTKRQWDLPAENAAKGVLQRATTLMLIRVQVDRILRSRES